MPVKLQVVMTIPGKDTREFEYEFDDPRISIGRDQSNDIQVPLSTVSRQHCVLFEDDGEWMLEDLNSTHGTKHNGKPVGAGGKKLLRDGDTIDLIHFKITFHVPSAVSPDYSADKTEALARRMVEEVLASIGKEGGEAPYLRVMNGPDEGKKFEIGPDISEATVGRGNDCDFQINDANMSRQHAVIRRDWNEITIEDAGSKNGVVLNDRKLARPTPLRDADEILLGAVRLTFIDPSAKFIDDLAGIPAFQQESTVGESSEVDEDPVDESSEQSAAGGEVATPPEDVRSAAAMGVDGQAGDDGAVDGPEPDPFEDDIPEPRKGLGPLEIGLIALAVLAIVGLGVGVAVLVAGS